MTCDDFSSNMPPVGTKLPSPWFRNNLVYINQDSRPMDVRSNPTIQIGFGNAGFLVQLNDGYEEVTLDLFNGASTPIAAAGFDSLGNTVASDVQQPGGPQPFTLTLKGDGIRWVRVFGGDNEGALDNVCYA